MNGCGFGRGDLCDVAVQSLDSLALLAVMVGQQHPLDTVDADFAEVIEHASVADVNQQSGLPTAEDMDVAGVSPHEQIREVPGVRLAESGGGGRGLR